MSEDNTNTKAFNETVKALLDLGLDMDRGIQVMQENTISQLKYQLDSYQQFAGPWLCILQSQMQQQKEVKGKK